MFYVWPVLSIVLLVMFDQGTKYWATVALKPVGEMPILEGVFSLSFTENSGAAFGVLQGARGFFLAITFVALVFIGYCYVRYNRNHRFWQISLVLIASGALGNFIDRLLNGFVVDFLYFKWINFPVFNVADMYVVCGTFLLAIVVMFEKEPMKKEISQKETGEK